MPDSDDRTRVVFRTASTLNGFIADPRHSLAWLFEVDSRTEPPHQAFLQDIGAIVAGGNTYRWLLRETDVLHDPDAWRRDHGDRPWFVFTTHEHAVPDGADVRFVQGPVSKHADAIVDAAGGRAVWLVGGGELVGQFDDARLLTEVQVSFAPATLKAGAPLLPRDIGPDRMELRDVERFDRFIHATYSVRPRAPRSGQAV